MTATCNANTLDYRAWHSDAERRHKAGERQVYCNQCRVWCWPSEVTGEHETITIPEFLAIVRREWA